MSSKTLLYLSYSMPFIALILFAIFMDNLGFYMLPAAVVSQGFKLLALKKTREENQTQEVIGKLKKELGVGYWAIALLFGLGGFQFFNWYF